MSNTDGLNVLVVDDRLNDAVALANLLNAQGNDVRIATDGDWALLEVFSDLPDVMLLDLGLPRVDGLEVAAAVRDRDWPWRPWIIAVSGHDEPWVREQAVAAGVDAYIVKPVEPEELFGVLRALPHRREAPHSGQGWRYLPAGRADVTREGVRQAIGSLDS